MYAEPVRSLEDDQLVLVADDPRDAVTVVRVDVDAPAGAPRPRGRIEGIAEVEPAGVRGHARREQEILVLDHKSEVRGADAKVTGRACRAIPSLGHVRIARGRPDHAGGEGLEAGFLVSFQARLDG